MSARNLTLPDIDTQPDVYETEDPVVRSHDNAETEEPENESLVHQKIDVTSATLKFQPKSKPTPEAVRGSLHGQSSFEIIGKDEREETPLQKFNRLKFEVQQLSAEIEGKGDQLIDDQVSPKALLEQISALSQRIEQISPKASASAPAGASALLISQIQAAGARKNQEKSEAQKPAEPGQGKDSVVYELYYSPEQNEIAKGSKVHELESRLATLEKAIGVSSQDQLAGSGNLVDLLVSLEERLDLLKPGQLENLTKKLRVALPDLEKGKKFQLSAEDAKKVNELTKKLEKWDPYLHSLPALANRLRTLKQLHQEASTFSDSIKQLGEEQTKITDLLVSQDKLLARVEANFEKNNAAIQSNVDSLEKRISELLAKVERLGK